MATFAEQWAGFGVTFRTMFRKTFTQGYPEKGKAISSLQRFKDKLNVKYHVLYGGESRKEVASEKLPFLDHIMSYPTCIFIDRAGKKLLKDDTKLEDEIRKVLRQVAMEEIGKKPEVTVHSSMVHHHLALAWRNSRTA